MVHPNILVLTAMQSFGYVKASDKVHHARMDSLYTIIAAKLEE
jgi:hypothetical protein